MAVCDFFKSYLMREDVPGYIVLPPDSTIDEKSFLRVSMSVLMIELNSISDSPSSSRPSKYGANKASAASNLSRPTLIHEPSGSW
eukprot:CAMPEP_0204905360 /NCGR_PEP_ID=MMETSP1397-20131031/5374_1 /ASSEMBLY_ACC=CAM_ASM_000891 /TAXON_ID=49980 /ORGANISM="Climacostomum Climacostomum virens, Strain Stock W-24" /LENGTH=84 /DNA_ID=CAMNT_0052074233 /DNA_START=1416 /DNA_END=1670 /DNA_ORIENTATION=+